MSSSLTTVSLSGPVADGSLVARLPRWLREPLVHFVVLGGLLFAVDHFIAARADDPNRIVLSRGVDTEAAQLFAASSGREPTTAELMALRRTWLDNEVLFREGLALQVDKGDTMIRERVIFKALSVIDANVKLPAIADAELRAWFEAHRDRYDAPKRYNFQEAALAGDSSEAAVRAFVQALSSGAPGDGQAGLRVFKDRPLPNLLASYGADFARALDEMHPNEWRALKSTGGWHAMRVESIVPARPAVYEELRGVVMQDWKDAKASEARTAAVRALEKKYQVRVEADAR